MTTLAMMNLCGKAERLASESGDNYAVIEIDYHDTRETCVVPERYALDPEFEAFDGELLAVFYPDGESEIWSDKV